MKHPLIRISVRNLGDMSAELYPEMAPATVNNFLSLIEKHFYDGLIIISTEPVL